MDVEWTGDDKFSEVLQADTSLTAMLKEVMYKGGEMTVDPQENQIGIYGGWIHEKNLEFDQAMLEIADRIALHIKNRLHESA
ncbi:MAG TPA: hypothetical protein VE732_00900 [Nitrososphaera sp.]|nr:hypothetical protein [Nitrososphaera sp.]